MCFAELVKDVRINGKWSSNRGCDQLQRLRCAGTAMNAEYSTSGAINTVTKVRVADLEVL